MQIDLYARDKGLVLLGHSLGGSIAMHIAVNIAEYRKSQGLSKPVVVTFGTPLTGTRKWCHWLSEHTELYRVTNDNDPICRVPCWPLYQHPIGVSIHFRDTGPVLNPGFRDRLTNSYRGVFGTACRFARSVFSGRGIRGGFVDAMSIDDHRIMSYLNVASRYSDDVSGLIAGVKIR